MKLIKASTLTPSQRTQLRALLKRDQIDAAPDSVSVQWEPGKVESTRVSPLTKAQIFALVVQ